MKSIWICIILALIIALLIVVPHIFITDTTQQMQDILKKADTALEREDWSNAVKYCEAATSKWEKYSRWYEMITEHKDVDEIIRCLRQLERFVKENELPEARAIIAELDFLVKHLEEADNLSVENIF